MGYSFTVLIFKMNKKLIDSLISESEKKLNNIEYISVDFGSERGMDQKNTVIEVNSFLLSNNFKLYKFSNHRTVGLYKKDSLE